MNKEVLIGITSKNRAALLPKSIDSALAQSYKNKQIAVYDDFSSDDTRFLVNRYPDVNWLLSPEEKGYLYARNYFLRTTSADYYCSLDDDSWFLAPGGLEAAVAYMDMHDDAAVLAFKILSPDWHPGQDNSIEPIATNNFIGCGHLLRVSAARKVGLYAVNPGYYGGEEKDLCIRLLDIGFSIIYFPTVEIWHEKSGIVRDQKKQHRSGVCNDLVFAFRRVPAVLLLPVIVFKLFSHLLFSVNYKPERLLVPCCYGIKDFFKFLFSGNINRKPVKLSTYNLFRKLQ